MGDPFSIAVAVAGLTSLGIQLVQSLNNYAGSALDSKGRITAISTDIDLTIQVFQALETTIQDDANRVMIKDDAERLARDAIKQCHNIFKKMLSTLPQLGPDGPSLKDRITYPLVEPKLELLRGNLEKVKTTLQLLMHVITFAAMAKRHAERVSLDQQRLEIDKRLEKRARAGARLEALERDHANALAARVSASPELDQLTTLSIPQDPEAVTNSEMVESSPYPDIPSRDQPPPMHDDPVHDQVAIDIMVASHPLLTMEEDTGPETRPKVLEHDDEQSPKMTGEHDSCSLAEATEPQSSGRYVEVAPDSRSETLSSSGASSKSDERMDRSPYSSRRSLSPDECDVEDFMIDLHDDYTACLRQLKSFQLQLEQALQSLYAPTVSIPVAKPDLDTYSRRKIIDSIRMTARQTSDCLDLHIVRVDEQARTDFPWVQHESFYNFECEGQEIVPRIHAKLEKGFFLSSNRSWTCYQHIYFSVTSSFELTPNIGDGRLCLNGRQVQAISMAPTAAIYGQPEKGVGISHISEYGVYHVPRSFCQLPLKGQDNQHTFKDLRFSSTTANNSNMRASQQYYYLKVELWADVRDDKTGDFQRIKVARTISDKVVVRSQSPSHCKAQESRGSFNGPGYATGPGSTEVGVGTSHQYLLAAPPEQGYSSSAGSDVAEAVDIEHTLEAEPNHDEKIATDQHDTHSESSGSHMPWESDHESADFDPCGEIFDTESRKLPTLDDLLKRWTNLPSAGDTLDENEET